MVFAARDESKDPAREPFATPLVFFLNMSLTSLFYYSRFYGGAVIQEPFATLNNSRILKSEPIPGIYVCAQCHEDRGF
jgi:hypothetical protein